MRNLFVILLFLSPCFIYAQAQKKLIFQATVMDSATREKISGAVVQLRSSAHDTGIVLEETVTNSRGEFIFERMIPDTMTVRFDKFPVRVYMKGYEFIYAEFPPRPVKTASYEALRGNMYLRKQKENAPALLPQRRSSVRINGLVADSLTNLPVPGVRVKMMLKGKLLCEMVSQSDGGFITPFLSLSPDEADSLLINAVVEAKGYREGERRHVFTASTGKTGIYFSEESPVIPFTILLVPDKKKTVKLVPKDN